MNNINWRLTQGVSGGPVGDPSMEVGDWRAQLPADARPRIVNKIMETLKRHLPFDGHEGLQELKKIAVRFEEKIYSAATSQSDYLRKISLRMLTMEARSQNPMPDAMQANNGFNPLDPGMETRSQNPMPDAMLANNGLNPLDPGFKWQPEGGASVESGDWRVQLQPDSRERIVNKIKETLKRHLPLSGHEGLQELMKVAVRFEDNIYTTATSQSDYLRKISLKMLTVEARSQNPMPDAMQANNGLNPLDPAQVKRETVEDARHCDNEERMSRIEEQQACILALLLDLDRPSQPPVAMTSAPALPTDASILSTHQ